MPFAYTPWTHVPGSLVDDGSGNFPVMTRIKALSPFTSATSSLVNGQSVPIVFNDFGVYDQLFTMPDGGLTIPNPAAGQARCLVRGPGGPWSQAILDPRAGRWDRLYFGGSYQNGSVIYMTYSTAVGVIGNSTSSLRIIQTTYSAGTITLTNASVLKVTGPGAQTYLSNPVYDAVNGLVHVIVDGQLRAYTPDLSTLVYVDPSPVDMSLQLTIYGNSIYVPFIAGGTSAYLATALSSAYAITSEVGDLNFASGTNSARAIDTVNRTIIDTHLLNTVDRTGLGVVSINAPPNAFKQLFWTMVLGAGRNCDLIFEDFVAAGGGTRVYSENTFQLQGQGSLVIFASIPRPDLPSPFGLAEELVYCVRSGAVGLVSPTSHRTKAWAQFVG